MKLKLIDKQINVWFQPKFTEKKILFIDFFTKKLKIKNLFDEKIIETDLILGSIDLIGNQIYLSNYLVFDVNLLNYIKVNDLIVPQNSRTSVQIVEKEKLIYLILNESDIENKISYLLTDSKFSNQVYLSIKNPVKILDNKIIFSPVNAIQCFCLIKKEEIWKLDYKNFNQIFNESNCRHDEIFSVNEDLILASIYPAGLVGIAAETGEILWVVADIKNPVLYEGIVYSFSLTGYYYEIEAATGQILRKEAYAHLLINGMEFLQLTKPAITPDSIIISSNEDLAVLVIDRKTFTLCQRISLGKAKKKVGINLGDTPQVHGNRVYQLDSDKTLHVLEIEE